MPNRERFESEAFLLAAVLQADVSDGLEEYATSSPLRTDSLPVGHYTAGDTTFQPDKPLNPTPLAALPSKISRRYNPISHANGVLIQQVPDPMFMKDGAESRMMLNKNRITSVDDLDSEVEESKHVHKASMLQPGVDYARTDTYAAELMRRLGKPVAREARLTEETKKTSKDTSQPTARPSFESERLQVQRQNDVTSASQQAARLSISSGKLSGTPFIGTAPVQQRQAPARISLNSVQTDSQFDLETSSLPQNLSHVTEQRMNVTPSFGVKHVKPPTVSGAEEAVQALESERQRFQEAISTQQVEREQQLRAAENRIRKEISYIAAPVIEELELNSEYEQLKTIVQEVIREQHIVVRAQEVAKDETMSEAMRETLLRKEIAEELQHKFESRIRENNKAQEVKLQEMMQQILDRFLNP